MELTLSWINRTPNADSIQIFRADEPFAETSLPEPLASVAGDQSTYVDATVTFGQTYYYRTRTVKGSETATSALMKVIATTYTGPGPQELISGDSECGFFGEVTEQELDSPFQVIARAMEVTNKNLGNSTNWLKFYYKGKILFVAKNAYHQASYQRLYLARVTTGKKGPPKYPLSVNLTLEQYREDVIRGQRFIVRTLNGDNERDLGYVTDTQRNSDNVSGFRDSEYTDLILGSTNRSDDFLSKRKLSNYAIGVTTYSRDYFEFVQQVIGGYPLLRSCFPTPNSAYYGNIYPVAAEGGSSSTIIITAANRYLYAIWRPVLEWIGPAL